MQVGTKELKNRLSRYLRQVRTGEVIWVTDRGEVIAELRAPQQKRTGDSECLAALEAEGIVTVGGARASDFTPIRVRGKHRASHMVIEDRG
jgi:antitoxin (DNA-binding transcriptional repressor) of toxin-antitoxin stability system